MRIVLPVAAALVAVVFGAWLSVLVFDPSGRSGASSGDLGGVGQAAIGGPFTLVNQNGEPVTEAMLEGKPSLIYFGYTFCPDFCPAELANMARAADLLAARGVDINLVFITIDPERDTVAELKTYVANFHEDFIGLTGAPEQIAAAAKAYKVIYRKAESPDFSDYLMDHTTFVYAMGPAGTYHAFFRAMEDPEKIADTLLATL